MFKWRYFFPGSPSLSVQCNNDNNIDNSEQFTTILEVTGYSFMTSDISIFSQNLKAIEELHNKWNLYAKVMLLKLHWLLLDNFKENI